MNALIPLLRDAIDPLLDVPLVFFGHGNGALTAHELAHELSRAYVNALKHIVISSEEAPHARSRATCRHQLGDDELLEELQDLGGTPTAILSHCDFMTQILPAARADFATSKTHAFSNVDPLNVPASLWWGRDDHIVSWPQVDAWRRCFAEAPRIRVFNGGHFYFQDNTEVVPALRDVLRTVVETDFVRLLQASCLGI
jgi:surfactin synthase thioesterase subunit